MARRFILPLLALMLLSGCILVNDFGSMWNNDTPDSCIKKIAEPLYFSEFRRDPAGKDMGEHARAISIDGHYFLLLKQEVGDKGGRLYRFGVINGIFQRYRLNPAMKATFLKDYPDAPVSLANDTVTLATIGRPEMLLLSEIAAKPEYWEIEDQALYNPLRSPLCRFDDRDLDSLDK